MSLHGIYFSIFKVLFSIRCSPKRQRLSRCSPLRHESKRKSLRVSPQSFSVSAQPCTDRHAIALSTVHLRETKAAAIRNKHGHNDTIANHTPVSERPFRFAKRVGEKRSRCAAPESYPAKLCPRGPSRERGPAGGRGGDGGEVMYSVLAVRYFHIRTFHICVEIQSIPF